MFHNTFVQAFSIGILISLLMSNQVVVIAISHSGGNLPCSHIDWNNTVMDITPLFDNESQGSSFHTDELSKCIISNNGEKRLRLFFESDLDANLLETIKPVADWMDNLTGHKNRPEIILSLRYNMTENHGGSSIPKHLLNILDKIAKINFTNLISFDFIRATELCPSHPCINFIPINCLTCHQFKFGYTVRREYVKECDGIAYQVTWANFIIVKIIFSTRLNLPWSYTLYKKYLDSTFLQINSLLSEKNKEDWMYYQVQFSEILRDQNYDWKRAGSPVVHGNTVGFPNKEYECLFDQFLQEWRKTCTHILVQSFPANWTSCSTLQSGNSSTYLLPLIFRQFVLKPVLFADSGEWCTRYVSIMLALQNIHNDGLHSVVLYENAWIDLIKFKNFSLHECSHRPGHNITFGQTNLLNLTVLFHEIYWEYIDSIRASTAHFAKYFGFREPKFSCLLVPGDEDSDYVSDSILIGSCDEISLDLDIQTDLSKHPDYKSEFLTKFVQRYYKGQQMIRKRWPNKTAGVTVISADVGKHRIDARDTLYCTLTLTTSYEYFEVVANWAETNKVPISTNYGYDGYGSTLQWLQIYAQDSSLQLLTEEFPLYLRRSYAGNSMTRHLTPNIYPCLQWLTAVPLEMGFGASQMGAYFKLNFNPNLTGQELFVMLLFSLATFRMTMVTVENFGDLTLVFDVISSQDFKKSLAENSIVNRELFFEMRLATDVSQNRFMTTLENLFEKASILDQELLLRFHFSNLITEDLVNLILVIQEKRFATKSNETLQMGIHFENCEDFLYELVHIHEYEGKNLSLTKGTITLLLENLSYIVCTIPANGNVKVDKNTMQTYFETHFIVKTTLQFLFPNLKKVFFSVVPNKLTNTTNMKRVLSFYSHVAQFGKAYNIPYFLLPAFKEETSDDISWWKIRNYSYLEDPATYSDIHSEYIERRAWRPTPVQRNNPNFRNAEIEAESTDSFPVWLTLVSIGLLFAVMLLIAVVIKARKHTKKQVTVEEIQEFLKGKLDETSQMDNEYNNQITNREYNYEFEISKNDIFILKDQILGMGNFGVVYKANIQSKQCPLKTVAVKMPRERCDTETFIGMLREVKLLTYLGNHQNVVEFFGCYTKEIERCVLYILLELCTGGSLLSHLRKVKTEKSQIGQERIFANLIGFSRDIASGMKYISSRNIIHGDLSARNVLLDEMGICKISDFGLSRKLYQYRTYSKKTNEPLPWRWMSYESLKNLEFSIMSDVWSFGVTLWEVFSLGDVPYPGQGWTIEFVEELQQGMRMLAPEYATAEIYENMATCWKLGPQERPTFPELFNFFVNLLPYTDLS